MPLDHASVRMNCPPVGLGTMGIEEPAIIETAIDEFVCTARAEEIGGAHLP